VHAESAYTPLKITFFMRTPICLTYPFIHFDALLAHLTLRRKDPLGYRCLPSKKVVKSCGDTPLPLKKHHSIYHASISFFDTSDAYTTTIYKRFCERYLNLRKIKKKRIDKSRGLFKDYMISLVYIPARKVTFYACGNADEIKTLLQGLPALGKKTAIGYGFVKSFEIKEIDKDYSIIKDGKAMRAIPIKFLRSASDIARLAYKAPYWASENTDLCATPGASVKLDLSAGGSRYHDSLVFDSKL